MKGFDYGQNGMYFVTICAWNRENLFGQIVNGEMELSSAGEIVQAVWDDLPNHHAGLELDAFVIMPNHIHAILALVGRVCDPPCPMRQNTHNQPSQRSPKSSVPSRRFRPDESIRLDDVVGVPVWQRNYFERVIRSDRELLDTREYIQGNPVRWDSDEENPSR